MNNYRIILTSGGRNSNPPITLFNASRETSINLSNPRLKSMTRSASQRPQSSLSSNAGLMSLDKMSSKDSRGAELISPNVTSGPLLFVISTAAYLSFPINGFKRNNKK